MRRLVAIDLPGGAAFVEALQRIWDRGDAAMPIDQRLPPHAAASLVATLAAGAVIDAAGERALDGGRPCDEDDALVVATSGSTGDPKGVVLTHAAVRASAEATSARLGVTDDDHWLACLPLAHVGGLSVITRALHRNITLTVLPGFDVDAVLDAARRGATLTSLVPTALARVDATLFRAILLGGSATPAVLPDNVITTYGMTETGSGVVYDGTPLDGVEIEIAADGEIWIRAAMTLHRYRDGSPALDADGWLHTGDVGEWRDGRLVVHGRRGEMIITGGENVWPEAVETVLRSHPDVVDVGVAGVVDAEWGQVVTAWVIPRDRAHPPTLEALRDFGRDRLAAFALPRSLVVVDDLPRAALGKVQRRRLGG